MPVGEVLEVGDALSFLAWTRSLILLDDLLGADPVGQLGDHDALTARGELLDPGGGPGAEVPRPVSYASRIPSSPTILPPVGRSGPGTNRIRSSRSASGLAIRCRAAATTSTRLCGAMLVAMPTAMPAAPLTSRLGTPRAAPRAGARGRRSWARSRRCPRRARPSSPRPPRPGGLGVAHGGRAVVGPASRSCRARRPAGAASRTAAPSGPARRRWRRRRAGAAGP